MRLVPPATPIGNPATSTILSLGLALITSIAFICASLKKSYTVERVFIEIGVTPHRIDSNI